MTGLRAAYAVLLAVCVLAGCSAASGGGGPVTPGVTLSGTLAEPRPAVDERTAARILRRFLAAPLATAGEAVRRVWAASPRPDPLPGGVAAHFAIPRLRGHPRWFAAGAVTPGATGNVVIFVQRRPGTAWQAHRLVGLVRPMPELYRDAQGYAVSADPGRLARRQAAALTQGADDALAHQVHGELHRGARLFTDHHWRAVAAAAPGGATYALRTADGGLVAWYVVRYTFTARNPSGGQEGYEIVLDERAARMLGRDTVRAEFRWHALHQGVAYAPGHGGDRLLGVSLPGWVGMAGH